MTCGNHIGALSVSVKSLYSKFSRCAAVTVDDAIKYYLSKELIACFHRCYASGVTEIPGDGLRAILLSCLRGQPTAHYGGSISTPKDRDNYKRLIRAGVLVTTEYSRVKFSSPAASQFIN